MAAPIALDDNVPAEKDRMKLGEALEPDAPLISPNGLFKLVLQKDGNLVLYKTAVNAENRALWDTGTGGRQHISTARLEHDGRLYLLDLWGNDTANNSKANKQNGRAAYGVSRATIQNQASLELRVQDDGNMVIYANGEMIWETKTTQPKEHVPPAGETGHRIVCGEYLISEWRKEEQLVSRDGRFKLKLQDDGNLVLSKASQGQDFTLWSSKTDEMRASWKLFKAMLQDDGNFVVTSTKSQTTWQTNWESKTAGKNTVLTMQDDGNLTITSGGFVIWSTDTAERGKLDSLQFGESCVPDAPIMSPNQKYRLVYQSDENIVLYGENNKVLWSSGTHEYLPKAGRMTIDEDGKLTTRNNQGQVKWQSDNLFAPEKRTAVLKVTDDGQVVITDKAGAVMWSPTMDLNAPQPCTCLKAGQFITESQKISSPDGKYFVAFAEYGTLAIRHESGVTAWESPRTYEQVSRLVMQRDGDLVLQGASRTKLWSSGARGYGKMLLVENNGNLKISKNSDGRDKDWELGVPMPALNGPVDRLTPGQSLKKDPQCLTSSSGRYLLKFARTRVPTGDGDDLHEDLLVLEDVQAKSKKHYFLADRRWATYANRLTLTTSGNIEIIEDDMKTVSWTSGVSASPDVFQSYEFLLQDDGEAVLYGLIHWARIGKYEDQYHLQQRRNRDQERRWDEEQRNEDEERRQSEWMGFGRFDDRWQKFERNRRERDRRREQQRYYEENARQHLEAMLRWSGFRKEELRRGYERDGRRYGSLDELPTTAEDYYRISLWELDKMRSYPSKFWPGRSRLRKGDKLTRGQVLSLPDDSITLRINDTGDLVIDGRSVQTPWQTKRNRPDYRKDDVEYLIIEDDGNLVMYAEGAEVTRSGTTTTTKPYKEMCWSSGTAGSSSGVDKYLQLEPGKAVLWVGGEKKWDSSQSPPTTKA